jgi:endonuclease YncB( thermonuclease family)
MGLIAYFLRPFLRHRPERPTRPVQRPDLPQQQQTKTYVRIRSRTSRYATRIERAALAIQVAEKARQDGGAELQGRCWVIDGDTIVIGALHIRLAGIDAPELDQPWGQKSKWALVRLCKGHTIRAEVTGELSYNRVVARCYLPDGRELSAEMVRMGLALDWACFSGGRYRHLEPDGARRRLWRAAGREGQR